MAPKTVFITGANRGIGLGIVEKLLGIKEIETIIAGARNLEAAKELQSLAQSDSRLQLIQVDVSNDQSLSESVKTVEQIVGNRGLNLLINNAGMIEVYQTTSVPERQKVLNCINVNAVSALLVSQSFLPLLQKAAALGDHTPETLSASRAAILNIGSDCSSQTLNVPGFCNDTLLAYKMSKTAMLSFARTLTADFKSLNIPVLVTTMHPGWVLTDMGGPNAPVTPSPKLTAPCWLASQMEQLKFERTLIHRFLSGAGALLVPAISEVDGVLLAGLSDGTIQEHTFGFLSGAGVLLVPANSVVDGALLAGLSGGTIQEHTFGFLSGAGVLLVPANSVVDGALLAGLSGGTIHSTHSVSESAGDIVDSFGKLNAAHNGGLFDRKLVEMPF